MPGTASGACHRGSCSTLLPIPGSGTTSSRHASLAARLGDVLAMHRTGRSHPEPETELKVEHEVLDRLRALGYVE
jgi:hypothetical protein